MHSIRILFQPLLWVSFLFFIIGSGCHQDKGEDYPAYHNPAVQPLTDALAKSPNSVALLIQRSQTLASVGALDLAYKDLKKARSIDSLDLGILYSMAELELKLNHADTAAIHLKQILKIDAEAKPVKLLLSKAYYSLQQYPKAQTELESILGQDSSYPGALYQLATVKLALADTGQAISTLHAAMDLRKDNIAATLLLARTLSERHDKAAVATYREAFAMDTTRMDALIGLGYFYQRIKNYNQAKQVFKECLLKDPHSEDALIGIGTSLMKQDSLKKALRHFNIAIQIAPTNAEAYYQKGLCFKELKQIDSATIAFASGLSFAPEDSKIKEELKKIKGQRN